MPKQILLHRNSWKAKKNLVWDNDIEEENMWGGKGDHTVWRTPRKNNWREKLGRNNWAGPSGAFCTNASSVKMS